MAFCASIETPNRLLSSTHHLLFQSSSLVNYLSKIIISLSLPLSYASSSSSSPSKTFTESEARSRLIQFQRSQLKVKNLELVVFERRLKCLWKKITLTIGFRKILRMAFWC